MKNGVVIVTYNRLVLLKECIQHVLNQTEPISKIIVVNNCSTDGTDEYLQREAQRLSGNTQAETQPELIVINETENLGGAGGFHHGMEIASKMDLDWVLIIDDDAMIRRDYMEQLMNYAREHEEVNALSGTVYVDGKIDVTHRRVISSRLLFAEKSVSMEAYEQEAFHCECATFCGLVIRGRVMEQIGLPKAEYFIWYDDSEYSLRLKSYGGIVNVCGAGLDHRTVLPQETQGLLDRTSWRHYYGYRNRYDTARLHLGGLTPAVIALEYHVLSLMSRMMQLMPGKKEQGRFNVTMIGDALRDGRLGKLGYNKKYHR